MPSAWNQRYEDFLGIQPPHDGDGVLQDVHWGSGLIGYFPTYALGNLYAAQLFDQMERDLGSTTKLLDRDAFQSIREWLRLNVHQRGQCLPAKKLIRKVTGKALSEESLVAHLRRKFEPLYGLSS